VSELRKDPFTGRWAVIAEGRGARPNEHATRPPRATADPDCPFCEGHEDRTPAERAALRPTGSSADGPGWTARAIPNKFPSLGGPRGGSPPASRGPIFETYPADGVHEVIIESPTHSPSLAGLPQPHRRALFRFFRDRVRAVESDPSVASVLLFENWGPESGGTLWHPHAQLAGFPRVPTELAAEERRFAATDGCLLEDVTDAELGDGRREVVLDPLFAVITPFGSEHPYELRLVPRAHRSSFASATDAEVDRLADLLPALLGAIDRVAPGGSYNWYVHGAGRSTPPGFHWHLDIVPRVVRPDGFELGSGWMVNPVPPEVAATRVGAALDEASASGPPKR
jgi:UDPglucose--hexose-1-phosphate uridylyltransferase